MNKEPQLLGLKPSNQLVSKQLEQKAKELEAKEQFLIMQQQQLNQTSLQLESAFTGIVRSTYLQCWNWGIDESLNRMERGLDPYDTEQLTTIADGHYNAIEIRVKEIAESKLNEVREKIKEEAAKKEAEKKESEPEKTE